MNVNLEEFLGFESLIDVQIVKLMRFSIQKVLNYSLVGKRQFQ